MRLTIIEGKRDESSSYNQAIASSSGHRGIQGDAGADRLSLRVPRLRDLLKSAILRDAGIDFTIWGIAIVKALLLAKFMLLGRAANIGKRYKDSR